MVDSIGQVLESGMFGDVDYDPKEASIKNVESDEDRKLSMESRTGQQEAGDFFKQGMYGKGPSVAQQQMYQGRNQAMKAALATAASSRGANTALAGRSGAQAAGQVAMQTNQQAAQLRAQEQQAYAQQYAANQQAQRMQDLQARGLSIEEAKAQLDYEAKLQATKANIAIAEQKGAQSGVAGIFGLASGALAMSDETAKTNLESIGGSPLRPEPGRVTVIQPKPYSMSSLQGQQEPVLQPGEGSIDDIARWSNQIDNTQPAQQPAAAPLQANPYEKPTGPGTGKALGLALAGYSGGLSGNMDQFEAQKAQYEREAAEAQAADDYDKGISNPPPEGGGLLSSMLGGYASGLGARSDERAKNFSSLTKAISATKQQRFPLTEQMAAVPASSWNYDPQHAQESNARLGLPPNSQHGSQTQVSPTAQQLERVPVTKGAVFEDRTGLKNVDTGQLALTNTAAIGEMSRRLKELEAQKDAEFDQINKSRGKGSALQSALTKKSAGTAPSSLQEAAITNRDYEKLPPQEEYVPFMQKGVARGLSNEREIREKYATPAQKQALQTGDVDITVLDRAIQKRKTDTELKRGSELIDPQNQAAYHRWLSSTAGGVVAPPGSKAALDYERNLRANKSQLNEGQMGGIAFNMSQLPMPKPEQGGFSGATGKALAAKRRDYIRKFADYARDSAEADALASETSAVRLRPTDVAALLSARGIKVSQDEVNKAFGLDTKGRKLTTL